MESLLPAVQIKNAGDTIAFLKEHAKYNASNVWCMNSSTQKREARALKDLRSGVEIVFETPRFYARKPLRLLNGEKTSFSKISRYVWTERKSGDTVK